MNLGLRNNPMLGVFLPYTNLGVGFVLDPVDWLSILTAVTDAKGKATTTGFDTAFREDSGTSVIHELDFRIKPFGLPGTQRVGFVWTSKDFEHLQPPTPFRETGPLVIKLLGPNLANKVVHRVAPFEESPDNVAVYYNFDQYVYTDKCDPTQGIGLFGRFGWARRDVNPINYFYSIGVGGKGLVPDRPKDTYGVGYYYLALSDQLPSVFCKEVGVELYYNIEITPWLHISPDIQIIGDPGGTDLRETAFVYGFRMQMSL
jgi:porin